MSEHSHRAKFYYQLILASFLLFGFAAVVFFFDANSEKIGAWWMMAGVAGTLLCGGVFFMASAIGHKIKSDFNRRAKQHDAKHHAHNE